MPGDVDEPFRVHCTDCGWEREESSFDRPYTRKGAVKAAAAHSANQNCDYAAIRTEPIP